MYVTATVSDAHFSISPATNLQAVVNIPLPATTLATFTDSNPNNEDYYQAIVTWEPGHKTTAAVNYDSQNNCFDVSDGTRTMMLVSTRPQCSSTTTAAQRSPRRRPSTSPPAT